MLETSPYSIDSYIIDNVQSYETPEELNEFLLAIGLKHPEKIQAFIDGLFIRNDSQLFKGLHTKGENQPEGRDTCFFHDRQKSSERKQVIDNFENSGRAKYENSLSINNNVERRGDKIGSNLHHKVTKQLHASLPFVVETLRRRSCLCNAQTGEHQLIGNCLSCGKIVCSVEDVTCCSFCGGGIAIRGSIHQPGKAEDDEEKYGYSDDKNRIRNTVNNHKIVAAGATATNQDCDLELKKG